MISTREEAEKTLGKPTYSVEGFGEYRTETERVGIHYSVGPCKTKLGLNWNVSKNIITTIGVRFKYSIPVSKAPWNLRTFSRRDHPTISSRQFYASPAGDIDVETHRDMEGSEKIVHVRFDPGRSYSWLLCKETPKEVKKATLK